MASGWQTLGNAIGGGNKLPSELAYEQGQSLGANTQNALAEARARVDKNQSLENLDANLADAIPDPRQRAVIVRSIQAGQDPRNVTGSQLDQFKLGQQQTVADPNTTPEQTARSLLSIGQPANLTHAVGEVGSFTNELTPGVVNVSPLGAAIAKGTANKDNAAAAASNSEVPLHAAQTRVQDALAKNGGKFPSGDRAPLLDANGQPVIDPNTGLPVLTAREGGASDINAPKPMSAVSARYFQNSGNAILQGAAALSNIVNSPGTPSSGWLGSGIGGHTAESPMSMLRANILNKVNPDDVVRYNTMMAGLAQNLATADQSGRFANQALVSGMDRVKLLPTDTEADKLTKLAEAKQILSTAATSWSDTNKLNDQQNAFLDKVRASLDDAIPFDMKAVNRYVNSQNPRATMADMIGRTVNAGKTTTVNSAAPSAPAGTAPVSLDDYLKSKGF